MSRQGYNFPDGGNKFFNNQQQYKFTFAQGQSEGEALKNAQKELRIGETDKTFVMEKKLANGDKSLVVFSSVNQNEYYKHTQ